MGGRGAERKAIEAWTIIHTEKGIYEKRQYLC